MPIHTGERDETAPPSPSKAAARSLLRLLPLLAATYFMVSGGPYDIEDIIGYGGYGGALLLILLLPVFWSFPTALMLGELASAVPDEGGFYAWVRRALGPFRKPGSRWPRPSSTWPSIPPRSSSTSSISRRA